MYTNYVKLSYDEQLSRYYDMQKGNKVARQELIESCMPLAKSIATKCYRKRFDRDDLISEATLALIKAVDNWNPKKGKLTTIVYWCVLNRMHVYAYELQRGCIWVPPTSLRECKNGKAPKLKQYIDGAMNIRPLSKISKNKEWEPQGRIKADYDIEHKPTGTYTDYKLVGKVLSKLNPQDREIIRALYGIDRPKVKQNNIKKEFGFTKQWFSRRAIEIMSKLKETFNAS